MYKCNGEPRSRNECCRAKVISIKYSVCPSEALGIRQTKRMRRIILLSQTCLDLQYFSHITNKRPDFRGKKSYWTQNVGFDFLYKFCLKHFSL